MNHPLISIAILLVGCGAKGNNLPIGASPDGNAPSDDTAGPAGNDEGDQESICDEDWNHDADGVAIQPESCLAWSPLSLETMDWYTAASIEDGEAGGCGSDCPSETDSFCTTLDGLGGRVDWRLPSKRELMDAAQAAPTIPDLDGRLWSRDTASGATGNAWTVDLGRAGSSMSMSKEDDGVWARCVSDS
jgi:hypothetical protein